MKLKELYGKVLKFPQLGMPYSLKNVKKIGNLYIMFFASEANRRELIKQELYFSDSEDEEPGYEKEQARYQELFKSK